MKTSEKIKTYIHSEGVNLLVFEKDINCDSHNNAPNDNAYLLYKEHLSSNSSTAFTSKEDSIFSAGKIEAYKEILELLGENGTEIVKEVLLKTKA